MKFMKRAQIYKANNVSFDPATGNAYSYSWWRFVARIDGLVVFNSYRYSVSTRKHQAKVRTLLTDLGINIDLELPIKRGLWTDDLSDLILACEEQLCDLFLIEEMKRDDRNERNRQKRAVEREKARQRVEQRPHLTLIGDDPLKRTAGEVF